MTITQSSKYTDVDLEYFEDAWANTLAGKTIDTHLGFVFGRGVKPTFELIKTKGMDQQTINKALEKYDDLKDELMEIDSRENINFNQMAFDAARMAKVFGRSVISFEPAGQITPDALAIIHPRDLGRPYIRDDYSLSSVKVNYLPESLPAEQMIYFCNQPNSPIRRQMWYGYSEMQRVVGATRALRRIVEYDSPEIVESLWAKYCMILVNTMGMTEAKANQMLQTVGDGLAPGAFNVLSGKKGEDIDVIPLDMEAQVGDLVTLMDRYERLIVGNWSVPGPLMGREEESNMATLLGKIRLYLAGPVAADRVPLSQTISKQWYERIIRKIQPDALKEIRVKAEFTPIIIESWVDNVDAASKLGQALPSLPETAKLELLNLQQYKTDLETNNKKIEQQRQMQQQKPMQVAPDQKAGEDEEES